METGVKVLLGLTGEEFEQFDCGQTLEREAETIKLFSINTFLATVWTSQTCKQFGAANFTGYMSLDCGKKPACLKKKEKKNKK